MSVKSASGSFIGSTKSSSSGISNIRTGYFVNYLAVAGGGGGGGYRGGGGGAGGLLTSYIPLSGGTTYTITIGAGGALSTSGSNTTAFGLTLVGGGRSADIDSSGTSGGSGGGAGQSATNNTSGGSGTAGQGNAGGSGRNNGASDEYRQPGGGGGAGGAGAGSGSQPNGGVGLASSITGTSTFYAGGGGGSPTAGAGTNRSPYGGLGGNGGGGQGDHAGGNTGLSSTAGTANTGGGGGNSSAGGSGIVIVSYVGSQRASGGTVTNYSAEGTTYTVHTFTGSGTFTA